MSDSINHDIFEGMPGFIKGLETFYNAFGKVITWYEENADIISSYLQVFAEFGEWRTAIDKLIENQFVFTDNLTPGLAHEIYQGADVEKIMTRYYFDNDEQNMKKLIQRCKESSYIHEYPELFNQILNAYSRKDYLLSCIGLFSLIDGLLAKISGINTTGFQKRFKCITDKLEDRISLNESDRKSFCICIAFGEFDYSVFKNSTFSEAEPQAVNRHWDVHGRTHRKHTRIDFLKVFLYLDAVLYVSEQLGKEGEINEHL